MPRCAFPVRRRFSWASGRCPTPTPSTSSAACSKEMAAIQSDLPSGLQARVAYDATDYITNAIHEVLKTLGDTLLIVVVIIFLFLGSVRSVIIPVVAIPLSLIGARFSHAGLRFHHQPAHPAGHRSLGRSGRRRRHRRGRKCRAPHRPGRSRRCRPPCSAPANWSAPIIAMTVTLAAVYAPIGLQGGLTGSLFREFAFTLAGAVAISGVVALTLSPMMSAKLLKPGIEERGFAGKIARDFQPPAGASTAAGSAARCSARPAVYLVWMVVSAADHPDVHHVAQGAGADRGSGGHFRHHRRGGQLHARPEQPLCRGGQ